MLTDDKGSFIAGQQVTVETGAPALAMRCGGKIKPRMALLQLPCMSADQLTCNVQTTKVISMLTLNDADAGT